MVNKNKLHIVAVSGMIYKNSKLLIVKRNTNEIAFPGKWQFPGGKVEGKENCETALKREILEETGLKVKNIKYLKNYEFTRPDKIHVIGIAFICDYKSGKVKISEAHTDFAWIAIKDAKKYDFISGLIKQIILAEKIRKKK